jgi:hypothetical protein
VFYFIFCVFFLQEVVGALVAHAGSGFTNEADSSLDVLSDLVEHHPSEMSSFAVFLKVRVRYPPHQFTLPNTAGGPLIFVLW